ncbi:hypothetical protein CC80DRAFT_553709 [Byssothecium circinans]|uniref:Uncharacterized protein n=1 Tax=Byssothecium circinans TaxID=147558 RepID=A0A6A5TE31_9PLEO|nr:hypothetical protein CC80DRAFT_553709 [Byssothecium circinans]
MFLWVRLVLDSLEAVYSPEELHNIVDDLPSDLEALYERILRRLCNVRGPHNYGGVPRIMSWICFARRPLHKDELLHGLATPPTDTEFDAQGVPLAQILDHCKPFVKERSDSTVVLVHFSVKEHEFFLKSKAPQVVPPTQAQLDISSACAAALMRGLDLLHPEAAPSYNLVRIATGGYRLLPYALEFWIKHCLLYASTGGPLDPDHTLPGRLNHLRNKHDQPSQRPNTGEIKNPSPFEASKSQVADWFKLVADIPTPSPPWLQEALQKLREEYPGELVEAAMPYSIIDQYTLQLMNIDIFADSLALPANYKAQYAPRIRCVDCPGKLYNAGPEHTVDNFEMHLNSRAHKANVEKRAGKHSS